MGNFQLQNLEYQGPSGGVLAAEEDVDASDYDPIQSGVGAPESSDEDDEGGEEGDEQSEEWSEGESEEQSEEESEEQNEDQHERQDDNQDDQRGHSFQQGLDLED